MSNRPKAKEKAASPLTDDGLLADQLAGGLVSLEAVLAFLLGEAGLDALHLGLKTNDLALLSLGGVVVGASEGAVGGRRGLGLLREDAP